MAITILKAVLLASLATSTVFGGLVQEASERHKALSIRGGNLLTGPFDSELEVSVCIYSYSLSELTLGFAVERMMGVSCSSELICTMNIFGLVVLI